MPRKEKYVEWTTISIPKEFRDQIKSYLKDTKQIPSVSNFMILFMRRYLKEFMEEKKNKKIEEKIEGQIKGEEEKEAKKEKSKKKRGGKSSNFVKCHELLLNVGEALQKNDKGKARKLYKKAENVYTWLGYHEKKEIYKEFMALYNRFK